MVQKREWRHVDKLTRAIYEEFVMDGATRQINISGNSKETLDAVIGQSRLMKQAASNAPTVVGNNNYVSFLAGECEREREEIKKQMSKRYKK